MGKSPNRVTKRTQVRSGLYIYQTPRSPYWYAKVWIPAQQRYFTKSTKETDKLEARDVAIAFADKTMSTLGHVERNPKATRFETYADKFDAYMRSSLGEQSRKYLDYHNMLYRKGDGVVAYFADFQVSKINAGTMRDYLSHLDSTRDKPLAGTSKKKHLMALRAVLRMAFEDEVIERVPDPPAVKTSDKPRTALTDQQYKEFIRAANRCIERGDVVSGMTMTHHHVHVFRFIVHSFVRPTTGELFGLRHRDIQVKTKPPRLEMVIRKGKTGLREAFTMPFAVAIYKSIVGSEEQRKALADEYVFLPNYPKRDYARTALSRIFRHILREAGLDKEEDNLVMYSLRHYAFQKRIRDSHAKVDINTLAKNAGTSVDMLERFYLSKMTPSPEIIEEFQRNG